MMRAKPVRLICAALLLIATFLLYTYNPGGLFNRTRSFTILQSRLAPGVTTQDGLYGQPCSPFASGAMDNVAIVLKMGAGEVGHRLPSYLEHLGPCKHDLLLFSDREAEHNGIKIHDALANLSPEYRDQQADFAIYNDIQHSDLSDEKTSDGWKLDKYKFLPMAELARHLRPTTDWFVFIELDTYVNWDNMHRFLAGLNPQKPLYLGSPVWPPFKPVFAHGGTGFVLSGPALDKLIAYGKQLSLSSVLPGAHMYDIDMSDECCGDEVLADVLAATGITLRGYWPMFNGEKPYDVPFGTGVWCEALLTLHHLGVDDFIALDEWEASSSRPRNQPLTFEDLFSFIEPSLQDRREDWTNRCEDVVYDDGLPASSVEACLAACTNHHKCLQYEHVGSTCKLSYAIRLGHSQVPDGEDRSTSGWMLDRIHAFKAAHSPCDGPHLVSPNP